MERILLVSHSYSEPCYEQSQIDGLLAPDDRITRFEVNTETWDLPPLNNYTAVIVFVRFRELATCDVLPWRGFSGLRVLLDQDAFMDFCGWNGRSPYEGMWTRVFVRLGFDLLICTGQRSVAHFRERGIASEVLYKAYDDRYFYPLQQQRHGFCHYGNPYAARRKALRTVRLAGINVDDVKASYTALNSFLAEYEAVIICNWTSRIPFGRLGASLEYRFPGTILRLHPSPEPMIKNFEAMGAGCAVFMDPTPDDASLGFVDGATCITYSSLDELIEKLHHYKKHLDEVQEIAHCGANLVRTNHTWNHRGRELRSIIDRSLA